MYIKLKSTIPMLVVFVIVLVGCDARVKFVAPEIDPPADLIPGYVPEGFELISGFQIPGDLMSELTLGEAAGIVSRLKTGDYFLDVKSPARNVIQGSYYRDKQHIILVTKSYFPGGTLDDWLTIYNDAQPKPCDCECTDFIRLEALPFPARFEEFQEERTIDGTRVAILNGPSGWITVFIRGDYLLTVESEISLEENLKIVSSLINN